MKTQRQLGINLSSSKSFPLHKSAAAPAAAAAIAEPTNAKPPSADRGVAPVALGR